MIRKAISIVVSLATVFPSLPLGAGEPRQGTGFPVPTEIRTLNDLPNSSALLQESAAGEPPAACASLSPAEARLLDQLGAARPELLDQTAGAGQDVEVVKEPPMQPNQGEDVAVVVIVLGLLIGVILIAAVASAPAA